MEKNTTGRFLSTLRKAKGMTQKELAELLNVSDKAVSRWEREECMPDILLLPVIADIFDVTCDDLLRGERVAKGTYHESPEKQVQRMKALVKKSKSKFQAFSMISIGSAMIGFLSAVILNFSFNKATIGFFCALIGMIVGAVSQTAFYVYYKNDVDTDELKNLEFLQYKKYIRDHSVHIFCILGTICCICLPLLIFGQVSYADYIAALAQQMDPLGFEPAAAPTDAVFPMGTVAVGLQLKTWILYGGIGGFAGAIVSYMIRFVMKVQDVKKERFNVSVEEVNRSKKNIFHFLKYFVILAVLLSATYVGSRIFEEKMPQLLATGTQFDNFEDFKEHMQTVPEDMYWGVVELRTKLDKYKGIIYGDNGEVLCEYRIYNDSVTSIEYGDNNKLPITVYSENDLIIAQQKIEELMWVWNALMVLEVLAISIVYFVSKYKKETSVK